MATKADEATGEAAPSGPPQVFVVVTPNHQVSHHGIVFRPLEIAQVPEGVAAEWIEAGWAVPK
jgi:hypothetical protein